MKTLKFAPHLVEKILSGEKTSTWRLFDDKDLKEGDELIFINKETGVEFGTATITSLKIKTLGTLSADDWTGHEKFSSDEEMYATYRTYYDDKVDENSEVKILTFDLKRPAALVAKEAIIRFFSEGLQYTKNIGSNIRWWRVVGIVFLIFIVTTPGLLTFKRLPRFSFPDFTSISWHYVYKPSITSTDTPAQKNTDTKVEVPRGSLSSASVFARLTGAESKSPPISICLNNDSKPIPPGMEISTSSISSEVGAMSFKVRNTDTLETVEIYAKVGTSTCDVFQGNQTEVLNANDLEWNNIYAIGNVNGQPFASAYINFGDTKVDISTTLMLKEYAFELFITLLGIGILIQILDALRKFIIRHPKI